MRSIFKCEPLQRPYRNIKCSVLWLGSAIGSAPLYSEKSVTYAAFTAERHLMLMQALKLTKPQDDPVYLFLLKKEEEGKPKNVAKMAAVNKFLRIYYARAMELYK